ncbi:DNA methyltransferase [Paenibacillus odorifer]|uniref:DNA methylase n=1 Tax=Paenibacillus odorifer TaxID=189426 RepID=A0A1R0Y5W9_9BACL|nr:DNA methyltransferase [Paenibacillus odorifer]OMD42679.1 DNA methylase [Paenibacillus odorifer]
MTDKVEQLEFQSEDHSPQTGPVTCLGMTFKNDVARRAYFTEELRKKMPELRKIEGFPIGEDEDILALSDPPYYTACPNPWVTEFITEWESQKLKDPEDYQYHREPFVSDVSEGKSDPIYRAHTYHTKVPHKAIMHFILHYTRPGDVVFDGFCGTGMTGLAAQFCGNRSVIETMGYKVSDDKKVLKMVELEDGQVMWEEFSLLGERKAILSDLAPAATFISRNYNAPIDYLEFEKKLKQIANEIENEYGWMYETFHTNGCIGKINSVVWSDIFICSSCNEDVVYWKTAVSKEAGGVLDQFPCAFCGAILTKRTIERKWETVLDSSTKELIKQVKQVPVLISYTYNRKRYLKEIDKHDLELLKKIEDEPIKYPYPTNFLPKGFNTSQPDRSHGINRIHHFYTKRNLLTLSKLSSLCGNDSELQFILTGMSNRSSKMNRIHLKNFFFGGGGWNPGEQKGTLYVSSLPIETSIIELVRDRASSYKPVFTSIKNYGTTVISTSSAERQSIIDNSIDYIFLDPPFGSNINYSELNFLWESWLKVWSNNEREAIENTYQGKGLEEYRELMKSCFSEAFRILKPGRWMTVEFSNTNASVWNSIQTALSDSGFVVANVAALDKKQGGFKAITGTTAVKQDLVISAYKPKADLINIITQQQDTEESAWTFVRNHLEQLPVHIGKKGSSELIVERTPRVLFDRMVSYYVQNTLYVPLSSAEFQAGVEQRFPMRDGMAFLESQVAEYDKKRILAKEFSQLSLFVSDENSAIEWLRQQLLKKPQTRQDLHPNFMKEIQHIAKHELLPELDMLLEQNFLKYDGDGEVPSQIHTYLSTDYKDLRNLIKNDSKLIEKAKDRWYVPDPNKQGDLEKLREKSLLREFNQYVEELSNSKKKLKQFRTEAIRVGFYKAWSEKNYQTIVDIGNRLPESILQEDEKLLRYFDNAQTKLGL